MASEFGAGRGLAVNVDGPTWWKTHNRSTVVMTEWWAHLQMYLRRRDTLCAVGQGGNGQPPRKPRRRRQTVID